MQEERKLKLEKHLKDKEEEMLEKQKHNLERKSVDEGNQLLGEVGSTLVERSRQLKSYVIKHHGHVSKDNFKVMVEEISEYLMKAKGSSLKESHAEIHSKLVETVKEGLNLLSEGQNVEMTAEAVVGFAERFDKELISYCFDNSTDKTEEIEQDKNGCGRNEKPRRWIIMHGILNELKEDQSKSMDLEENEPIDLNHVEEDHGISNGSGEPQSSTGGRKRNGGPGRSSRCLKGLGDDSDVTDSSIIGGATVPKVPPSKKQRTGYDFAKQNQRRIDGSSTRRSSRLKHAFDNNLISAPRRNNPLTANISNVSVLKNKLRSDVDEKPLPNFEDDDIAKKDSTVNASSSPPSNLRVEKDRKGNGVSLESPQDAVSMTTRRASTKKCKSKQSSDQAHSRGSKLRHASRCCRIDDKCPKQISIVKGAYPMYSCNICKIKFKWREYLKYHGEFCGKEKNKSFICKECGKGFHRKDLLLKHARIHTGEKPFQCPQCPERFVQKWNLQTHIRCHTNDALYKCKSCNLTFVSSHGLHEHNLTHEGKLLYPCSRCDKRYDQVSKLHRHIVIHTDERPFMCPKCGVSFRLMECLVKHLELTHCKQRETVKKLTYQVAVAYLMKETKNESCREIPDHRINSAVMNHVIKKANLLLPNA